ncbi:MAG: hypothetical protein Q8T03_09270 [Bacteroidota bacterium]|nr:hypothetical protein [Bacteroidota bacterium]
MKIKTNRNVSCLMAILFILVFSDISQAQKNSAGAGIRFGFGPVLGLYNINPNHAKNPTQKMSALVSFRKEIKSDKSFKNFFLFGFDYFFHGVNFKSYYFKPGSLQLYDKTYPYNYSLIVNELGLPIQFKHSFKKENNSVFSPYIMVGYHLRYLLPGNLLVTQNGNKVKEDNVDLKFRNGLFSNKINSFLSASVGWQKNSINKAKGSFFAELNFRYSLSQYYFEENYAASSLYISSMHLALQLGLKF